MLLANKDEKPVLLSLKLACIRSGQARQPNLTFKNLTIESTIADRESERLICSVKKNYYGNIMK